MENKDGNTNIMAICMFQANGKSQFFNCTLQCQALFTLLLWTHFSHRFSPFIVFNMRCICTYVYICSYSDLYSETEKTKSHAGCLLDAD